MKKVLKLLTLVVLLSYFCNVKALTADHSISKLSIIKSLSSEEIESAKELEIVYWHTSHGSQLTDGLIGLGGFMTSLGYTGFTGTNYAGLNIVDKYETDLGNESWDTLTRTYLTTNPDTDVVMWSWCGQLGWMDTTQVNQYLTKMNALETEYPDVKFIYMTGHLFNSVYALSGQNSFNQTVTATKVTNDANNEIIRTYCKNNNKTLYDFADIESYDPNGTYYSNAKDDCSYEVNGVTHNWAGAYQDNHTINVDWYYAGSQHSQPLNSNLKAYGIYWLMANINEDIPAETVTTPEISSIINISYNQINISIDKTNATHYQIYRTSDMNEPFTLLTTAEGNSYPGDSITITDSNLETGKTYYYKVRGYKSVDTGYVYSVFSIIKMKKILPSTPTLSLAATGYSAIKISWNKIDEASGYEVYRSTDGVKYSSYKVIKDRNTTSFLNSSLVLNKTYYYKVRAFRTVNHTNIYGDYSNVIISSPYLKTAVMTSSDTYYRYIKTTWETVSGATGYYVYRSESETDKYEYLTRTSNNYYTDTTAKEGITYFYKIRPYRIISGTKYFSKTYSNIDSGIRLNDSISFSATNSRYGAITLSITKNPNATKYYIYRATSKKGKYTNIAIIDASTAIGGKIEYTNTGLSFNKKYYYKVRMTYVNASDYSGYKYAKTIVVNRTTITAVLNNYRYAKINIAKSSGATGYIVYRSDTVTGPYSEIGTTKNLYYADTTAKEGNTYYYIVKAYKTSYGKNYYSSFSNTVSSNRLADSISFSTKSNSYNAMTITINKDVNATKYYIYRATSKKGKYTNIAIIDASTAIDGKIEYTNTGLSFNKTYYYKVRMSYVNASDYSGYKYAKTIVVNPTTITAVLNNYRYAKINIAKSSGATGYIVYRSDTETGTYSKIGTTKNLYYADTTAKEGNTYYYKVKAYKTSYGKNYYSSFSNIVSSNRLADSISFSTKSNSYNAMTITINKDVNATKYYIYRADSKTGKYTNIAIIDASTAIDGKIEYTNTGLSFNKTYYYKVRMSYVNASDYSDYKYAKTTLSVPNVTYEVGDSYKAIKINIEKVIYATGYEIYKSDTLDGTYSLLKETSDLSYQYELTQEQYSTKKTYYYIVRAYRLVNGTKIYGSYTTKKEFTLE